MKQLSWWLKSFAAGVLIGLVYYLSIVFIRNRLWSALLCGVGWIITQKLLISWNNKAAYLDNWKIELLPMILMNLIGAALMGLIAKALVVIKSYDYIETIFVYYTYSDKIWIILTSFIFSVCICAGTLLLNSKQYLFAFIAFCAPTYINGIDILGFTTLSIYYSAGFSALPLILIGNVIGALLFAEIYKIEPFILKERS